MELILPQTIEQKVANAARILGFQKQEIIQRALLYYLDSINSQLEIQKEFECWDKLSDEALEICEKVY